jgi:hypothetical protein
MERCAQRLKCVNCNRHSNTGELYLPFIKGEQT